jgi:hypothetical protein
MTHSYNPQLGRLLVECPHHDAYGYRRQVEIGAVLGGDDPVDIASVPSADAPPERCRRTAMAA